MIILKPANNNDKTLNSTFIWGHDYSFVLNLFWTHSTKYNIFEIKSSNFNITDTQSMQSYIFFSIDIFCMFLKTPIGLWFV